MQIKDKVAIVTGGASGLGEAVARRFVADGAKVAILDMAAETGAAIATELGENARFHKVNVTSEADAAESIAKVMKEFGRIDILANVAGIGRARKIFSKEGVIPLKDFTDVVEVNLFGSVNMMRLAVAEMVKNDPNEDGERGVIINTSSIAAWHGQSGQASYSASKGGINSLTLPVARDLARNGIRIFSIAPGMFMTPIYKNPAVVESLTKDLVFPKRFGRPSEFADMAAFIVGNPMMNGDTVRIDGAVRF